MGTTVGPLGGYSILVVDDEPLITMGLDEALRDAGADVLTAHDLSSALEAAVNGSVSAAILDVQLGASDCGALCAALSLQEVPFLFLTGFDSHDVLKEWASVPTLTKPTGEAELLASVEALLKPGLCPSFGALTKWHCIAPDTPQEEC
jgi:DNA-binding response OmpR family regulator